MRVAVVEPDAPLARQAMQGLADAGHVVTGVATSPEASSDIAEACRTNDVVGYFPTAWEASAATHEQHWVDALVAGLEGSGKRLIYLSDASVVGPTVDGHVGSEDSATSERAPHPWRVRNEQVLAEALSEGVRSLVVRPALIYGRGAGRLVQELLRVAADCGQAFYVADGSAQTSTIHVDDLVTLLVAAIVRAPAGSRYFAASDEVVTWREVAEAVAAATGGGCVLHSLSQEAATALGLDSELMTMDCVIRDAAPGRRLSWQPSRSPLLSRAW